MTYFKKLTQELFLLLEVTKIAQAAFDHTYLADELEESTHQTNFQMLSVF